jgi:membrane protein implicated in regulation of membrane protease activity
MDFGSPTLWWVVAGLLVAAELATGTFYLLMLALGAAAAALAAHLGFAVTPQIVAGAAVGAFTTTAWHWHRKRQPPPAPAATNRDVNLDIGERVQVPAWNADGSARVQYRGALWTARYAGPDAPRPGEHYIIAVEGNRLVLAPDAPNNV